MYFQPKGSLLPTIVETIPGDKSISHRAIIVGALTKGQVTFHGFLTSEDCLHTLAIFQALGVHIEQNDTTVTIQSPGIDGFKEPKDALNVGNSGTGIRLITGVLSALPFHTVITGDASIQQRPMARIADPLNQMGANIELNNGSPPIHIKGSQTLTSFSYTMPVASAQVKSCLLLAAHTAQVPITIIEPEQSRDHTERMFMHFGADLSVNNTTVEYRPSLFIAPSDSIQIPSDVSSALFFMCLAIMTNQAVTFQHIGLNPSRIGCLTVLQQMGVKMNIHAIPNAYEPMGDIHISDAQAPLNNIVLDKALVPNVIDELPILAVLATHVKGVFSVRNAKELRVKESDRIHGICTLCRAIGAKVTEYDDGFDIEGPVMPPTTFEFDSQWDHRLAMSALVFATANGIEATVHGTESIATSFPNFLNILNS